MKSRIAEMILDSGGLFPQFYGKQLEFKVNISVVRIFFLTPGAADGI